MTAPVGTVEYFPPEQADLTVMQGSRYRMVITVACDWEPDFTGWDARMEVRPNRSATAALYADLAAYLSVNAVASQVTLDIPADAAEILAAVWTQGVYDIEMFPSTGTTRPIRVLQGSIKIDREVTR